MKETNKESTFLVTQSNQLIEANYSANLTTLAHKVVKLIVGLINPQEEHKNLSVTIEINKLKSYLGWSKGTKWNRFYNDLKDISKRLNKEPIEIPLEGNKITVAYFLSSYTLDPKAGKITFDIAPKLVPYLTKLKANFTTYQLRYIPTLTSSYSIRMYELFYQYRRIGSRRFAVNDFKKKIGAPEKYKYNDLKKRILIPAQTQLKENTNLAFIFNEVKTGRSITNLEFVIFNNTPENKSKQIELDFLNDSEENIEDSPAYSDSLIQKLNKLGISEQNIAKYLSKGFEIIDDEKKREKAKQRCTIIENYYFEKFDLLKNSPSGQSKSNAAGFFIKAISEDWNSSKNIQKIKAQKEAEERKQATKKIKKLEQKIELLSNQRTEKSKAIYAELLKDKDVFKKAYDKGVVDLGEFFKNNRIELMSKPINDQYAKNPFIESVVNTHLHKMFPDRFGESKKIEASISEVRNEIDLLKKKYKFFS